MQKLENMIKIYINEELTDQLSKGIKVESEHRDLYDYFKKFCEKNNLKMPLTENEFFEYIANSHLREMPNYYDLLSIMEKSAKKTS